MKLLHILGAGPKSGDAGVVLAIVRAQVERRDEVWIASSVPEQVQRLRDVGAQVFRLLYWFETIHPFDIVAFLSLFLLCRKERFDLVVTYGSKGGFLGRFAARLAGVPHVIHHTRAFHFHQLSPGLKRRFFLALEKAAARAGDLIISVSEAHRQSAIRGQIEKPERILTIVNGVDVQRFRGIDKAAARCVLGLGQAELIIGSVGELQTGQGWDQLLRAMPMILARHPSTRLVIAGTGPLDEELQLEAALSGIADRVTFLGFRKDIVAVMSSLDVFIKPGSREGPSFSLLEAMAAGSAIVACDIPGNREVIEHSRTGLLVPPHSSQALASAICLLLGDAERAQRLGRCARKTVESRLSVTNAASQNLEAYDRLLYDGTVAPGSRSLEAEALSVGGAGER